MGLYAIPTVAALRSTNLYAAVILLVHETRKLLILRVIPPDSEGDSAPKEGGKVELLSKWSMAELYHVLINISIFPPLFFFYGLYYTDVISALFVLMAYRVNYAAGSHLKEFLLWSLFSLFMRQTNIFWVSVFCGGLKVCRTLAIGSSGPSGAHFPQNPSISHVIARSWQHSSIYDPLVSEACFEGDCPTISSGLLVTDGTSCLDYVKSAISITTASISSLRTTISALRPHFLVLGSFGVFVLWNGGVVLGTSFLWPYI